MLLFVLFIKEGLFCFGGGVYMFWGFFVLLLLCLLFGFIFVVCFGWLIFCLGFLFLFFCFSFGFFRLLSVAVCLCVFSSCWIIFKEGVLFYVGVYFFFLFCLVLFCCFVCCLVLFLLFVLGDFCSYFLCVIGFFFFVCLLHYKLYIFIYHIWLHF